MLGFPIRTPSDHSSFDNSPRTIAAYHVLHRLLVPRHPPNALTHLQQHLQTTPNTNHHPQTAATARIECRHHQKTHKKSAQSHTNNTPSTPQKKLNKSCRREIKMLASTMHFSNNTHRTQLHASAPHHRTPHRHTPDLQLRGQRVFPQNPDSVTTNRPALTDLTESFHPHPNGAGYSNLPDVSPSNTHTPHGHTPAETCDAVCSLERR